MNRPTPVLYVFALILVQGCASQRLSPAELEAKRTAPLNVYEDNRVTIKSFEPNDRLGRPGRLTWLWTADKNAILALDISGHLYNTKDISRITAWDEPKKPYRNLAIYFRNGDKALANTSNLYGNVAPKWVRCDTKKVCSADASGTSTGIYDEDLSNPSYKYDPRSEIRAAIPDTSRFQELVFLNDVERLSFETKLDEMDKRWASQKPRVDAANKDRDDAEKAKDAAARQLAIKNGKINCTSTNYACGRPSYDERTALNCGDFRSFVGEMRKDGWVIANVNREFVPQNALSGSLCDHNIHHFYYTR